MASPVNAFHRNSAVVQSAASNVSYFALRKIKSKLNFATMEKHRQSNSWVNCELPNAMANDNRLAYSRRQILNLNIKLYSFCLQRKYYFSQLLVFHCIISSSLVYCCFNVFVNARPPVALSLDRSHPRHGPLVDRFDSAINPRDAKQLLHLFVNFHSLFYFHLNVRLWLQ